MVSQEKVSDNILVLDSLPKFTERAVESQLQRPDVNERAERFRDKFMSRMRMLESQPIAFGNLTVRYGPYM